MPEEPQPQTFAWPALLTDLLQHRDLDPVRARATLEQVMAGQATPAQIAGFLVALNAKRPAAAEIAAFVDTMLAHAVPVSTPLPVVDTCGTGGDHAGTVNISTMAAIVVAAAGVPVVKHGNRSASSKCGSADLLEELGIRLDLDAAGVEHCLAAANIGFCFAQSFHPAMRFAGPVRRELGIPTVFNILGPLSNPARPAAQLVGVADPTLAPVIAEALLLRGTRALVVRGEDGLDEITTLGPTRIWSTLTGRLTEHTLEPLDLAIPRPRPDALIGGVPAVNATIAQAVLRGEDEVSAVADAVCLNAAGAIVAAESAGTDLLTEFTEGIRRAREAIETGAAHRVLQTWRDASQQG